MEPIPTYSGFRISTWDREEFRNGWQILVECGVETNDLRDTGKPRGECFDQGNLRREMGRVELDGFPDIREKFLSDELRIETIRATVDDPMPDTQ